MSNISKNYLVSDQKPRNISVLTNKPRQYKVEGELKVYTETRTINKGQPVPWGLNWLITYPVQTLNFPATRI